MVRFPIPVLFVAAYLASTCATFDVTQPVSNAPDLVSFLRAPRSCFTPCGVRVTAGDCESLQRYEGRVLERLAPAGGWDAGTICEDLAGFTLEVHAHDPVADRACGPHAWWRESPCDRSPPNDTDGGECGCIAGITFGAERRIVLSTTDWEHSAFAHEVAHVADENRPGHCPWRAPLLLALLELSHRVEGSTPGPECSP
jgi:hypothetical protein